MHAVTGPGGGIASATSSTRRSGVRGRVAILIVGGGAMILGLYTGLARGGIDHRFVGADLHAVLMVLGFLGTLIALERAVGLGERWAMLAPVSSAAAVVALPFARTLGGLLLIVAGAVTTLTYVALVRRRRTWHLIVMALGGVAWVTAAVLWLAGSGPVAITPLLAAFLVLTIVGERLELSRLTLPAGASRHRFLAAVGLFALGTALSLLWRSVGLTVAGIGLLGQVLWLVRYDLARFTVRRAGLPRFAAVCTLSGYVWLAVSGVLWIALGAGLTGHLLHDALVHSLFLGFVLSMVMGHAPIVVPAVLRAPLRFTRVAYLPLGLLHLSVTARVAADLAGSLAWREVALHGNVSALLLFVAVTAASRRRKRDTTDQKDDPVTRTRPQSVPRATQVDRFRGVRRLAIAVAAGTLLLIAMGGAVRATSSGLACPDWPACYGKWIPPADANMWFEHSHRLWAGVIAIAIAWLTVWTMLRFRDRPALWRLSLAASLLVLVQAGLGAAVVLLHLRSGLVTSHLGMSLVVVACLIVLAVIARPASTSGQASPGAGFVGRWGAVVGALVFLQALLGGQATGRGAGYVLNAFPIWLADEVWTGRASQWLHVTHRAGGYLVATAVAAFAIAVRRRGRTDPTVPAWAGSLAWLAVGLVVVQVALGITNVLTRASTLSALAHLTVASWLWATFVLIAARGLVERRGGGPSEAADRGGRTGEGDVGHDRGPGRVAEGPSPITEEINA